MAGAAQVIVGVAFVHRQRDGLGRDVVVAVLVGVKVASRLCTPPPGTEPLAGEYTNVPGALAVAFNCVALSAVP